MCTQRFKKFFILQLILIFAASLPVFNVKGNVPTSMTAQDPTKKQEQDQDAPLRLSSRLVQVPISVSDATGKPVKDLKADDIVIEEDGKEQRVVALGEPGKTPIDIALLFDVSGSTHGQFALQKQAAVQFIQDVFKPGDAVSLFEIGTTPKLFKTRNSNSREIITGIMTMEPIKAATAFYDAVVDAALYLDKNADTGSRRVLVVISDGEENYSAKNNMTDTLREIQKNDCLFYSINPSGESVRLNEVSRKGQDLMESLASQTGGKAFNLTRTQSLQAVFSQIAEELQAQYLFGYYTSDERNDGSFRRITVRAPNRPDLRIRARQGYYVPKG
ncbi:MAG: VWA domain-containing protein [Acidobacteriota bacterium]